MANNVSNLTPAQKNMMFAQMTRQMWQKLPAISLPESSSISFTLPKVNLTSKIHLLIEGSFTVAHASATSFTVKRYSPYRFLRNVKVSINNGFSPFQISGVGLGIYNQIKLNSNVYDISSNSRAMTALGTMASAGGTANTIRFMVELPFVLNERDPIGLILTQNEETVVTCQIDTGTIIDMFTSATGYTVSGVNIAVYPILETFSIPPLKEAMPDLSVLKLVQEQAYSITQTGDLTLKLPVGTTYRKIILDFEDGSGVGFADTDLDNFNMILNQADIPYSIPVKFLTGVNQIQYGKPLAAGTYVVDFSYQGIPNLGGARDYIDTERMTEFWIRTNAAKTGTVKVIAETLARLKG